MNVILVTIFAIFALEQVIFIFESLQESKYIIPNMIIEYEAMKRNNQKLSGFVI
jgi:hypothetical protein